MPPRTMRENGRQLNQNGPHLVDRTPNPRSIFLDCVKDDLFYRFRRGVKERSLAIRFGISREVVEEIIREKVANTTPTRPGAGARVIELKRAA